MFKVGDMVETRYGEKCRILYIVERSRNPYRDDIVVIDGHTLVQKVNEVYIDRYYIPDIYEGKGILTSSNIKKVILLNPKELLLKKILYVDKK